jgi:hypothetical protein
LVTVLLLTFCPLTMKKLTRLNVHGIMAIARGQTKNN